MPTVTNISDAPQGVRTAMGRVFLAPGESRNLNLDAAGIERVKKLSGLLKIEGDAVADPEAPAQPGDAPTPATNYRTEHRGGGKYSIFTGDTEVLRGLTKDQTNDFGSLPSDTDKAAYVEALKAQQTAE